MKGSYSSISFSTRAKSRSAFASGGLRTWRLSDGGALTFEHVTNDWHEITTEDDAFFMRVYGPGDFKFHGADLGILVTKGRMQTAEGLTERCRHYIQGIRAAYKSEPLPQAPPVMPIAYVK